MCSYLYTIPKGIFVVSGLVIKRSCTTQNNSMDDDVVMKSIDCRNCMLARESFKRKKITIKLTECILMLSYTLIFPFNSLAR